MRTDFVVLGNRGADRADDLVSVDVTDPVAVDFLDDDELLAGIRIERGRKCSAAAAQQRVVAVLHRRLDVFGVVIAAADDDEILQAPRNKQLAVQVEAEVTGAQERPAPGAREKCVERLFCFGRLTPIAPSDAAAGQPDLPDLVGRARPAGRRIHDDGLVVGLGVAATHERRRVRILRCDGDYAVFTQCVAVQVPHHRCGSVRFSRNQQGGFGHAVHGIERLRPEAGRGEGVDEPLQGCGANRLRTTHGGRQFG